MLFCQPFCQNLADKVCETVMASAVGEVDLILSYLQVRHIVAKLQGLEHIVQSDVVAISADEEVRDLDIDSKIVLQQIVNQKHAVTFACSSHSIVRCQLLPIYHIVERRLCSSSMSSSQIPSKEVSPVLLSRIRTLPISSTRLSICRDTFAFWTKRGKGKEKLWRTTMSHDPAGRCWK